MAGRVKKKRPLVIREAEFFSIELAPVSDGTFHLSITATTVDDRAPQLLTQDIMFTSAPTLEKALAKIREGLLAPA
jgi:hypothetical protein